MLKTKFLSVLTAVSVLLSQCAAVVPDFAYAPIVYAEEDGTQPQLEYELYNGSETEIQITQIPNDAADVTIPDTIDGYTVKKLSASAFYNCSSLKTLTIPANIALEVYGFAYAGNIEAVNVVGEGVFSSIDGVLFSQNDDGTKMLKYYPSGKTDAEYTIPAAASKIDSNAFQDSLLQSVTIPATVTEIGYGIFSQSSMLKSADLSALGSHVLDWDGSQMFNNCTSLESVSLPADMYQIPYSMFSSCQSLKTINIPDTVRRIDSSAFAYSGIEKIHIPSSVTEIADNAFESCSSLTDITVDDANTVYTAENNVLYSKDFSRLYTYPQNAEEFVVNDSVTEIPSYIMNQAYSLKTVKLPASLKKIGDSAFSRTGVTAVEIPHGTETIDNYAFYYCTELASVTLPNTLKKIGSNAFYNCAFDEVLIPAGVSEIGMNAFDKSKLTKISGYDNTAAQAYAEENGIIFESLGTPPVTEVTVETAEELKNAIAPYTSITLKDGLYSFPSSLTISGVTNLTIKAENKGCAEILSLDGLNTVIYINKSDNIALDGIIIGHESLEYQFGCDDTLYSSGYVIRTSAGSDITITGCDLYGCGTMALYMTNTENLTVKDSILRDCKECITDGYYNDNIVIENCILSGNAYDLSYAQAYPAFRSRNFKPTLKNCTFINNSSSVFSGMEYEPEEIADSVFYSNVWQGITPESNGVCLNGITWEIVNKNDKRILRIGYDLTFRDSSKLFLGTITSEKGEVLPYSASSVPWKGLLYDEIDCAEGVTYNPVFKGSCGDNVSYELNELTGELKITGTGKIKDYNSGTAPWSGKKLTVIDIGEGVTGIGDRAFYELGEVGTLKIASTIETIGNIAFEHTKLESVEIPPSVKMIGISAFFNCGIKTLKLNEGLETINSSAFGLNLFETVTLPMSLRTLAGDSFHACNNLTSVTIGADAGEIEENPFSWCESLTEIKVTGDGALFDDNGVLMQRLHENAVSLVSYPIGKAESEYTLPEYVTQIGAAAFEGAILKSVMLPDALTIIDGSAFCNMERLTEISIPETVELIGQSAFVSCTALEKIVVNSPDTVFEEKGLMSTFENSDKAVIYSHQNSKAQMYAADYGIPFKLIGGGDAKPVEIAGSYGDAEVDFAYLGGEGTDEYGKTAYVSAGINNLNDESRKMIVYVALYDGEGNIIGIGKDTVTIEANGSEYPGIDVHYNGEYENIRLFVFGGSGRVTPLCDSINVDTTW